MRSAIVVCWLGVLGLIPNFLYAQSQKSAEEPLLAKTAPGVFVDRTIWVPNENLAPLSSKLGGQIARLTNSFLRIHGRAIQVNVIGAQDEKNAIAIEKSLEKIKRKPFVQRQNNLVIEYVGKDLDEAIAIKASYELGVITKPSQISYKVKAELALIDKADYMSCNPLFLAFLQSESKLGGAEKEIADNAKRFEFGRNLRLRSQDDHPISRVQWKVEPKQTTVNGATTIYQFSNPQNRNGVPFTQVELSLEVDDTGLTPSTNQIGMETLRGTAFWPADDTEMIKLALKITEGAQTNDEKVAAILKWLAPGKNIKYSGQTGSRYGTKQVLTQKFGHCWDFSDVFVTLARAAGIPSRQIAGWLYGASGHVWCEYYREGKGWQQVDPTGGNVLPCGLYHLAYFTSEDGSMPIVYLSMPSIAIVDTNP